MLRASSDGHCLQVPVADGAVEHRRLRLLAAFGGCSLGNTIGMLGNEHHEFGLPCEQNASRFHDVVFPGDEDLGVECRSVKAMLVSELETVLLNVPVKGCMMTADFGIRITQELVYSLRGCSQPIYRFRLFVLIGRDNQEISAASALSFQNRGPRSLLARHTYESMGKMGVRIFAERLFR